MTRKLRGDHVVERYKTLSADLDIAGVAGNADAALWLHRALRQIWMHDMGPRDLALLHEWATKDEQ